MRIKVTPGCLLFAAGLLCSGAQTAMAQTPATPATTDPNGTPVNGQPTTGTTTPAPANSTSGTGGQRAIFLSGVVLTDDGSPLPGNVNIQSICFAVRRTMGHVSETGKLRISMVEYDRHIWRCFTVGAHAGKRRSLAHRIKERKPGAWIRW